MSDDNNNLNDNVESVSGQSDENNGNEAIEQTDKQTDSTPEQTKSIASELLDYVEIFIFSACAVLLLFTFFVRLCRVDGPSMNNTLIDGEILLISDIAYEPKQFDIIVFHQTHAERNDFNEPIVKRVIATSGHYVRIDFDNSLVYVSDDGTFDKDDIIDEEKYIHLDSGRWSSSGVFETFVPEGKLFVMGDNRNNSSDSRSRSIGLVDERRLLGKVLIRILPFSKIGSLY